MINTNLINLNTPKKNSQFKSSSSEKSAQAKINNLANSSMTKNSSDIITKKPTEVSFSGAPGSKLSKFYTSDKVKKVLEFAADKQLIFDAAFALLLTCILRPASIMVLPSKKNQDDQKYAAAHSIASGVIGFAISNIVFTPISNAIKKIKENPRLFITDEKSYLFKDEDKYLKTAKIYLDRLPDIVGAIPKGILTIALIPPILKYVFGMEKKKPSYKKEAPVAIDYSILKSTNSKTFQGLTGGTK